MYCVILYCIISYHITVAYSSINRISYYTLNSNHISTTVSMYVLEIETLFPRGEAAGASKSQLRFRCNLRPLITILIVTTCFLPTDICLWGGCSYYGEEIMFSKSRPGILSMRAKVPMNRDHAGHPHPQSENVRISVYHVYHMIWIWWMSEGGDGGWSCVGPYWTNRLTSAGPIHHCSGTPRLRTYYY